jgi:murein DD-endopeptidase MepM/ murein hydrolase activator NlpD
MVTWVACGREAVREAVESTAVRTVADTLKSGETLELLLRRGGLDGTAVSQFVAATPMLDPRRMRPGLAVEFERETDSIPATAVTFKMDVDHIVRVSRVDSLHWEATEEHLPWVTDTVVVRGSVASNLYDALGGGALELFPGGAHEQLVLGVADVYKFRVDMTRELRAGDSVYALVERAQGPESTTKLGHVLATRLFVGGKPIDAYYFRGPSDTAYYDDKGQSLATAFLHSPIDFARVTSSFGMRFHPILRIRRPHRGVDYGAVSGTPVHSIGDGTIVRVGRDPGGFGNVVEIRHSNGFVTRYAHLSSFNRSVSRYGARVKQNDVIGYVGMTGLATAPHLHFEILVGGSQTNPTAALRNVGGKPLPSKEKPAFEQLRAALAAMLRGADGVIHGVPATAIAAGTK